MRTTISLDPDAQAIVSRLMRDRGMTFEQAVNEAIRAGASSRAARESRTPIVDMGAPMAPLEKALRLASDLEDDELIRKLATHK